MSQQKVDKYRQDKANREKIAKHEKRMYQIEMTAAALIFVLLLGWIGFSVFQKVTGADETTETAELVEFDATAVQDYLTELSSETTEDTDTDETDTEDADTEDADAEEDTEDADTDKADTEDAGEDTEDADTEDADAEEDTEDAE